MQFSEVTRYQAVVLAFPVHAECEVLASCGKSLRQQPLHTAIILHILVCYGVGEYLVTKAMCFAMAST